jgi:HEAT repeat protein
VHTLIDQLADADENVSTAARDALVKLGDAAFAPLIEAIVSAPTDEGWRRASGAFTSLKVSDVSIYLPALGR